MKEMLRNLIQTIHLFFLRSFLSRIYVATVIAPAKTKTVEIYGTKCSFSIQNSYVNWYVGNFAGISVNEVQTQKFLLENVRDGDVIYDIGANIGAYVIWLANAFQLKQVVGFEPEAANYFALVENVRHNQRKNITCLPIAAGNQPGYVVFWTEDGTVGNASGFTNDYSVAQESGKYAQYVRQEKVDDLVQQGIAEPPDIVLIDVDGGELLVLEGMMESISNSRIVIVEVAKETEEHVHALLSELGFSLELERPQRRGNRIYVNALQNEAK